MSITLYRIEHTTPCADYPHIGMGAYKDLFPYSSDMVNDHWNPDYPDIVDDIVDNWWQKEPYHKECFCACTTLESLDSWFKGWKKKLLKSGYVVVEYIVTDIVKTQSMKQVMFHNELVVSKKIVEDKFGIVN